MTSTPHEALVPTALAPRASHRSPFRPLALLEALRLARHPALLVGTALGIVFTALTLNDQSTTVSTDALGLPVVAATVGLGSMLAAFYLTRSFHRADELIEVPRRQDDPNGSTLCDGDRAGPVASLWLVLYFGFRPPGLDAPEWMYGVFSHADVAAVLVGHSVIAALGGHPARGRRRSVVGLPRRLCRARAGRGGVDHRSPGRLQQRRHRSGRLDPLVAPLRAGRLLHLGDGRQHLVMSLTGSPGGTSRGS